MADTLPRLSVVIPLYKEEDNVERLVDELHAALETYPGEFELVLVDDGSTDRTREMLLDARANRGDHIMVISHRRNLGQTQAMQTGLQAARGDVIAFMDGDLQNDPADIPAMVEKLETDHLDLLCGWRKNRQDTLDRTLPSRMANWLIGRVSGVALHDYGCSLKVGRRDVLEGLDLRGEMHRFIPLWVANLTHPSARLAQCKPSESVNPASYHEGRNDRCETTLDRFAQSLKLTKPWQTSTKQQKKSPPREPMKNIRAS